MSKPLSILWVDDKFYPYPNDEDGDMSRHAQEIKKKFGDKTTVKFESDFRNVTSYNGEEGYDIVVCDNIMINPRGGRDIMDAGFRFSNAINNIHRNLGKQRPAFFLITGDTIPDGISSKTIDGFIQKTDFEGTIERVYTAYEAYRKRLNSGVQKS